MDPQNAGGFGQPLDQPEPWPMGFKDNEWIENRYRLMAFLGEGGMGCVFKALDLHLNRTVALKFMKRISAESQRYLLREARLQALVDHDHICKVYEVGRHRGIYFLAMQYLAGEPLQSYADTLPLEAKLTVMRDVAMAVHAAHCQGLIHRDLKPNNILVCVDSQGRLKPYVMDFGLARRLAEAQSTRTGFMQGTPLFMAPEQVRGARHEIDRRTDVYGLGATLHFLVCGAAPHTADNPAALLVAILDREVPSLRQRLPGLPKDVDAVVSTALAQDPQRRYASAKAMAEDLNRYLQGEPIQANPPSAYERISYVARRHKRWLAFATVSLVAILITLAWGIASRKMLEKKARIASEFVQRAEEVEAFHRKVVMLPLHNLSEARTTLKAQMTEVENHMATLGKLAEGSGHFSLGSGFLAMQDYPSAYASLQRAWDAGFREPQVALALGQALNALYQRELARVESLPDPEQRVLGRQEAHRSYRLPAHEMLRVDAGWKLEERLEAAALTALFEGREADAVALWQQLFEKQPWYYEALLYQGQVLTRSGDVYRDAGDLAQAEASYDKAETQLLAALEVGRSDAEVRIALAGLELAKVIFAQTEAYASPQGSFKKSKERCEQALVIDSSHAEPYRILAALASVQADHAYKRGENPAVFWQAALAHARACLARDPSMAVAYNSMGSVHLLMGRYAGSRGEDGLPHFNQAISALQAGLEHHANQPALQNNLGLAHLYSFQLASDLPTVDSPHYRKAVYHLGKSRAILPQRIDTWLNLGAAHWVLAEALFFSGGDPRDALCQAREAFEQVVHRKPDHLLANINLGNTLLLQGEYAQENFRPTDDLFWSALDHFRKVQDLRPGLPEIEIAISGSFFNLAKNAWQEGESPFFLLNGAADAALQALHIRPQWDLALFNLGHTYWLESEYAAALGLPTQGNVALAKETMAELLRINKQFATAWVIMGYTTLISIQPGELAKKQDEVKQHFQNALRLEPGNGFAHFGLAKLSLRQANRETLPLAERRACLAEAMVQLGLAAQGAASLAEVDYLRGLVYLTQARMPCSHPGYYDRVLAEGERFTALQSQQRSRDLRTHWLEHEFKLLRLTGSAKDSDRQTELQAVGKSLRGIMRQNPNLTRHFKKKSGLLESSWPEFKHQQHPQGVFH